MRQHGLVTMGASCESAGITEKQRRATRRSEGAASYASRSLTRFVGAPDTGSGDCAALTAVGRRRRSGRTRRRLDSGGSSTGPRTRYELTVAGERCAAGQRRQGPSQSTRIDDRTCRSNRASRARASSERSAIARRCSVSSSWAALSTTALRRGVASLRRLTDCAERLESGPGRRMSVIRVAVEGPGNRLRPGWQQRGAEASST